MLNSSVEVSLKLAFAAVALCIPALVDAAEYRPGWTAQRFYSEVVGCESAIVLPAIQSFTQRGVSKGRAEESLRSETVSMEPVFEHVAAEACHCALNQVAQYNAYDSFSADKTVLKNAIESQACKGLATPSVLNKDQLESLRLK
jgi:hypothetical protein